MALKAVNKEEKKDQSLEVKPNTDSKVGEQNTNNETVNTEVASGVIVDEKSPAINLTLDELQKMLDRQKEELKSDFEQRLKSIKSSSELDEHKLKGQELLDDYLDEPVTFFAYALSFAITADVRRGRESKPPLGMIKFKPLVRSINRNTGGRGTTVVSICAIKTHSQAEVNWLRSSPHYGFSFHESFQTAIDTDHHRSKLLVQANQEVQKMTDMQVVNQMKTYGKDVSTDIDQMRQQLTKTIADVRENQFTKLKQQREAEIKNKVMNPATGNMAIAMVYNESTGTLAPQQ